MCVKKLNFSVIKSLLKNLNSKSSSLLLSKMMSRVFSKEREEVKF